MEDQQIRAFLSSMGCGASTSAAPTAAPAGNLTVGRPAPLQIKHPAGDPPPPVGSDAERAEATAEAAASPSSRERTRWQAVAARQHEARDEAAAKLQALGIAADAMASVLSKAELPAAEEKLNRAEAWLADLDKRAADKKQECERAADECAQLQELKAGTRKRADMEQLLMSIAVRASETCAAAEDHAMQAVGALREPAGLQGLTEIAAWEQPPPDALRIFQAVLCLLAGVNGGVGSTSDETEQPENLEWATAVCGSSGLLVTPREFVESLSPARTNFLKATADGQAPQFARNATQARALMGQHVGRNLAMDELDDVQSLQMIKLPRNRAVALVCRWVVAHLAYQDAQLLLEESAGEAAFELKAHELSQHRGLHAALLAQREQASTAVRGQTEVVENLRSAETVLDVEEASWGDEKTAQVQEIVAEYLAMLQEYTDKFEEDEGDGEAYADEGQDEGAEEEDEDEDEDEEEDDDEEEQVRAGAAALIQSRVRGNAARKRVDGLRSAAPDQTEEKQEEDAAAQPNRPATTRAPGGSSTRSKSGKQLAVDVDATPNYESLGPIPQSCMENGALTVDDASSPPEAVAAAAAAAAEKQVSEEQSEAAERAAVETTGKTASLDAVDAIPNAAVGEDGEKSGASAAEKKAEFQKALQEFNSEPTAE